jgi:hypothetical protein
MPLSIPGDKLDPQTVKGFLAHDEGEALARHALGAAESAGPFVEIGSWCGRSSVYLGRAARQAGRLLFAVDHHRGSEEHQPGEGYHDPDLFDAEFGGCRHAAGACAGRSRWRIWKRMWFPWLGAAPISARHGAGL